MDIIEYLAHCKGESIMIIRDMIKDDINRTINGVVQVVQDVIKQENKRICSYIRIKKGLTFNLLL